jgi:hypothetical protein
MINKKRMNKGGGEKRGKGERNFASFKKVFNIQKNIFRIPDSALTSLSQLDTPLPPKAPMPR